MGTFSGIHRFHDAGEDPNVNNVLKLPIPIMGLLFENPIFEPRK